MAEVEVKIDKQGRVCDRLGRPLRDRRGRNYGSAPFMGRPGKERVSVRLKERIKAYEDNKDKDGRKKPGSPKR